MEYFDKKIMYILLSVFLLFGCSSTQKNVVNPLGILVQNHLADGDFSAAEIKIFHQYEKTLPTNNKDLLRVLIGYANDMDVFIKKYVWKEYKGTKGLYLYLARDKNDLALAWKKCSKTQKMSTNVVGFLCPYNNEAAVLIDESLSTMIRVYDHEEGHYQHDTNYDGMEFPSEYHSRWKAFLRFSISTDVGNLFFDPVFWGCPESYDILAKLVKKGSKSKKSTIQKMGKYSAGSLMFFLVANYYNGDLTKGAKFIFGASEEELVKFFYDRLEKYVGKKSLTEIWQTEVNILIGSSSLQAYLDAITKKLNADRKIVKCRE